MKKTFVRLVLAISLDGRLAFPKGGKSNLGGKGDRKVLEKALAWSDGTLMGSGTLRAHQNTCLIHNAKLIERRHKEGRSSQPISLIVSKNSSFSKNWGFFEQPITRWLLSPTSNQKLLDTKGFHRHLFIQEDWSETFKKISEEGCNKIVLLGGKKLVKSILLEDQIDELQLTIVPRILGGKYTWTPTKLIDLPIQLSSARAWTLKEIEKLEDNELMIKYYRNKS